MTLLYVKKLIAAQLNPLLIYCYGYETISKLKRSTFLLKQVTEEKTFAFDLLIIMPDESVIEESLKQEIQEQIAHFGTVSFKIHSLYFMLRKMNEGNIFFNWVSKSGILLYDRNATSRLLPPRVEQAFKKEANAFYQEDATMEDYLTRNFNGNA
ncbi:hypothetical protein [Rhizosphaericola mali]|uniref:Uncharacterized protein n=1 Tax=Rhizosphaericola mali TaxID=2545455 RepID=A0A5P2FYR6_9BACT|nr:hypothetical protein [Rhizosphaericola mali]QES88684.1 hypothetical protein E0W69_008475 [Rhizosphaericola mali]